MLPLRTNVTLPFFFFGAPLTNFWDSLSAYSYKIFKIQEISKTNHGLP